MSRNALTWLLRSPTRADIWSFFHHRLSHKRACLLVICMPPLPYSVHLGRHVFLDPPTSCGSNRICDVSDLTTGTEMKMVKWWSAEPSQDRRFRLLFAFFTFFTFQYHLFYAPSYVAVWLEKVSLLSPLSSENSVNRAGRTAAVPSLAVAPILFLGNFMILKWFLKENVLLWFKSTEDEQIFFFLLPHFAPLPQH